MENKQGTMEADDDAAPGSPLTRCEAFHNDPFSCKQFLPDDEPKARIKEVDDDDQTLMASMCATATGDVKHMTHAHQARMYTVADKVEREFDKVTSGELGNLITWEVETFMRKTCLARVGKITLLMLYIAAAKDMLLAFVKQLRVEEAKVGKDSTSPEASKPRSDGAQTDISGVTLFGAPSYAHASTLSSPSRIPDSREDATAAAAAADPPQVQARAITLK